MSAVQEPSMNQKAHITGSIILAGAAMIAGTPPLTASLVAFGSMFNDLDLIDVPWSEQGVHRKLFHNIYILGFFAALSMKYPFFLYWVLGMALHNVMDLFSGAPVYLFWPVSYKGEHIGVGGWGVPNSSMFSFPAGILIALVFSAGYLVVTDHLGDAITLLRNLWELFHDTIAGRECNSYLFSRFRITS